MKAMSGKSLRKVTVLSFLGKRVFHAAHNLTMCCQFKKQCAHRQKRVGREDAKQTNVIKQFKKTSRVNLMVKLEAKSYSKKRMRV